MGNSPSSQKNNLKTGSKISSSSSRSAGLLGCCTGSSDLVIERPTAIKPVSRPMLCLGVAGGNESHYSDEKDVSSGKRPL